MNKKRGASNSQVRAQTRRMRVRAGTAPGKRIATALQTWPTVMVKPHSHQPSKAELEADVSITGVSPEELARNLRNVLVVEDDDADTT